MAGAAMLALSACGSSGSSGSSGAGGGANGDEIVVGFSQVGAESGWRAANTKSIQGTLTKTAGFDLKFSDAQQKQENQIQAIRSYIAQGVDVIAFSPVVESGWDAVLEEAKQANIPVVLTDRSVDSTDTTLYASFLGSDFIKEGQKAGEWTVKEFGDKPTNIVQLEGTTGSAPANDRKEGFQKTIASHPNLKVIASQTGNFTRSEGKTVMEGFLQAHKDINMLYAHNDDMGLGAIDAIEAAGLKPGVDIKIVTVDAVKDGMTALCEGKINYIVECSPLLGPKLVDGSAQRFRTPRNAMARKIAYSSEDRGAAGLIADLTVQENILLGLQAERGWARRVPARRAREVPGNYQIQAAIAACHAGAPTSVDTDWAQIAGLYAELARIAPNRVVELNRVVAIGMAEGPGAALILMDDLERSGSLAGNQLLPATRADMLRRAGDLPAAAAVYREALALSPTEPERRFLQRRLDEVTRR